MLPQAEQSAARRRKLAEKDQAKLVRKRIFGKSLAAMLIVTQPMEAHVAKRRSSRRTITIITTTWTIRWWDGVAWVEQTVGPSVEIVAEGPAAAPEPPAVPAADQAAKQQEEHQ